MGFVNLLLKELSFGMPGVKIGLREHIFEKKFFEEPDPLILILMTLVTLVTKNTNFRDFGL